MTLTMRNIRLRLSHFLHSDKGSVFALTALMLPIIAGASLFAADHIAVSKQKISLQKAADAAAIATARELHFIQIRRRDNSRTLSAIADGYARQNMPGADLKTTATAESDTLVAVEVAVTAESLLGKVFSGRKVLSASAKAELFAGQNICIIAADLAWQHPGIAMKDHAKILANKCGIYSNSKRSYSIMAKGSSFIDAQFICAAGGYHGGDGNVARKVTEDCPQIRDPLEGRALPVAEACDSSMPKTIGKGEVVTLHPGTYCGGLTINGNAKVEFMPGMYMFREGPLLIGGTATVTGENVGLFFEDDDSYFEFNDNADIVLSAPELGPMAGMVVGARANCRGMKRCDSPRVFKITSANVRSLLGTIYLPVDDLVIDTTMPVSQEAAFTILIVDNLYMKQSPVLVLNTNYAATTVPVPEGFVGQPSTRIVQ